MSRANMPAASRYASSVAASRQHINVDLDAEVASILRSHAAEAHLSEGEIVDRAIRAYDLRSLVARIRARSDLDEDAAMALVREELHAARAERDAA
jgi:hypothetical protein